MFHYLLTKSIDVDMGFVGSSFYNVNFLPKFVVTHEDGGETMGRGIESCHLMRISAK